MTLNTEKPLDVAVFYALQFWLGFIGFREREEPVGFCNLPLAPSFARRGLLDSSNHIYVDAELVLKRLSLKNKEKSQNRILSS